MQQHWAIRPRSLSSIGLLAVVSAAAAAAAGCEGVIGDSRSPGIGANSADAGMILMPRAPGEIPGVGGGGGTGSNGIGGMMMPASDAGPSMPEAGGAPDGSTGAPAATLGPLVQGLSVSDVAIYQAVKVSLVKQGKAVPMPSAPLVRGRPGMIRVFVTPAGGWQARPVVARLQWGTGAPRDAMITVSGASADATPASTANFQLTADDLTANVQWSVELHEAAGGAGAGAGDTTGARIPGDGSQAMLTTTDPGPVLNIVLVPIRTNGNLPDTSDAQIKFLGDAMFASYPVVKVDVTVRDPIDAPGAVSAMGNGWDAALNQVCITRQNDQPARNVFYYGLIAPKATFQTYCAGGCVEGIAVLANNPNQDQLRCAMGIGYTNMGSGVFLQEVAHTMGRMHAPCGNPAQVDRNYPYAKGGVGVWGYDMVHQRLIDPAKTADFMSYCAPVWISDYTFSNLLPWIRAVNLLVPQHDVSTDGTSPELAAAQAPGTALGKAFRFPPARWRVATVESDGGVLWGPLVDFDELVGAEVHTVVVRDGAGRQSTVSGVLIPHSNMGGGMLLLPATTPVDGNAIQIGVGTAFRDLRGVAP